MIFKYFIFFIKKYFFLKFQKLKKIQKNKKIKKNSQSRKKYLLFDQIVSMILLLNSNFEYKIMIFVI